MGARLLCSLAFCAWLAPALPAAEDLRVRQLEQDIAQLKRTVLEQQRRIEQLERQASSQARVSARSEAGVAQRPAASLPWHAPINWDRLQTGMSEAQVIQILGPASVEQKTGEQKVLFYGGTAPVWGAISGIVELRSGVVARVAPPQFKQ
jgi:hypothetical protein